MAKQPTKTTDNDRYDVFAVREYQAQGEDRSDWMRIGVAFPHKNGEGYNVKLHAFPVDGELVIRKHEPKPKQDA